MMKNLRATLEVHEKKVVATAADPAAEAMREAATHDPAQDEVNAPTTATIGHGAATLRRTGDRAAPATAVSVIPPATGRTEPLPEKESEAMSGKSAHVGLVATTNDHAPSARQVVPNVHQKGKVARCVPRKIAR